MKKQKSASYDPDWIRENSEKEYGLPYEEALEMSYDNLRVAYDQLTGRKDEILQRQREAIERPLLAEIDALRLLLRRSLQLPRPWLDGGITWEKWDELLADIEKAVAK